MREAALKIAIVSLLGLASASAAKPLAHKPAGASRTPARIRAVSVKSVKPTRSHPSAKLATVSHASGGRRPAKVESRLVAQRSQPAPIVRVTPQPEQTPTPEPIQVTHNRKQHFAAEPDLPASEPPSAPPDQPLAQGRTTSHAAPSVVVASSNLAEKPLRPLLAPSIEPVLYNKQGRLIVPPALKGSHEILIRQNEMADRDGLDRIQDDADLDRMREAHLLVPIPAVAGLQADERLSLNRRYCRPWTAQFLSVLARAHYARFHTALQVNSAVRTVEVQERLLRTNGNAAPAEGETASPHLTGQAVDLAKHGLSLTEIAWLRGYLLPLVQAGKVDVEEEFQQACFHISVYRKYVPQMAPKREIAQTHHVTGATLAAAIR
jgi:hypothetical protein